MKTKVSTAAGQVLDWMVAKCEVGEEFINEIDDPHFYSTAWDVGGPIIEREKIELRFMIDVDAWYAQPHDMDSIYQRKSGPTPLIAAMRCYVASEMGEEVEVPDELTN